MRIRISKEVSLPDEIKLARYMKTPELGPKVLFFSGGTALRPLCRELVRYTYNSIHILTTFDSGGSSAKLRDAFHMPAIGDIRARLMALADQGMLGNRQIFELFAHRLPKDAPQPELEALLESMAKGTHPLVAAVPDPMRKIIRTHLMGFVSRMPEGFDLRGANIGNLVLAAGYLDNRGHLDPVIYLFSRLAEVRGTVRPVLNKHMHMVTVLKDGTRLVGQHLISAKEAPPITSGIREIYLSADKVEVSPAHPNAREKTLEFIRQAELICYPIGSFYSSVIVNFLPGGIASAISKNPSPKVFVPNMGKDPEALGLSVADQVERLLHYLRLGLREDAPAHKLLNLVLVDDKRGMYPEGIGAARIRKMGVDVVDCQLLPDGAVPRADASMLCKTLLSLT